RLRGLTVGIENPDREHSGSPCLAYHCRVVITNRAKNGRVLRAVAKGCIVNALLTRASGGAADGAEAVRALRAVVNVALNGDRIGLRRAPQISRQIAHGRVNARVHNRKIHRTIRITGSSERACDREWASPYPFGINVGTG